MYMCVLAPAVAWDDVDMVTYPDGGIIAVSSCLLVSRSSFFHYWFLIATLLHLGVHVPRQWLQASEGEASLAKEKLKERTIYSSC